MYRYLLLIFIMAICYNSNAEESNSSEPIATYDRTQITNREFDRVQVESMTLYKEYVKYINPYTGQEENVKLDDLEMIRTSQGNYAIEGFLLGGLLGVVTPVYSLGDPDVNYGDVALPMAIVGAVVGTIIGINTTKYKTVFHSGSLFVNNFSQSRSIPERLNPTIPLFCLSININ